MINDAGISVWASALANALPRRLTGCSVLSCCVCLVTLGATTLFAQTSLGQPSITSREEREKIILSLLQNNPAPTKQRVQILNDAAEAFMYSAPAQARAYAQEALRLADSLRFVHGIAQSQLTLGTVAYDQMQFRRGVGYDSAALMLAEQLGDRKLQADALLGLATNTYFMGNILHVALDYSFKALRLYEAQADSVGAAYALNRIGSVYNQYKDYAQATTYLNDALRIFTKARDDKGLGYVTFNLGMINLASKEYGKSAAYFEQSLEYYTRVGNVRAAASAVHNLGLLLMRQERYEEALQRFRTALTMFEDKRYVAVIPSTGVATVLDIAACLTKLGRLDEALPYMQRGIALTEKIEYKRALRTSYEAQVTYYEAIGDFKKALFFQKKYTALNDSVSGANWRNEAINIKNRYETERQETRIALLRQQQQTQQLILYGTIGGLMMMLALIVTIANRYRIKRDSEEQYREQNKQLHEANEELQHLNNELDEANTIKIRILSIAAHDLKNPLTSIALASEIADRTLFAPNADISKARQMLQRIKETAEQMTALVKDLLDTSAAQLGKIELRRESVHLSNLLVFIVDVHTPRAMAKQQRINLHAVPECILENADTARLRQAFDNLVSNAIKYSVLGGSISMMLSMSDCIARVEIHDSGPGFTAEDKEKMFQHFQRLSAQPTGGEYSTGIGLAIVKQIIELHDGTIWVETPEQTSEQGSALQSSTLQGSTFIVELPLNRA